MSTAVVIQVDDPGAPDVRALLEAHLAFSHAQTPAAYSFALDVDRLCDPGVTFFSGRIGSELVGVGALKRLGPTHGELKSMHTRESVRGRGVGRAMVSHILEFARRQGYGRVSLETGTTYGFTAARNLYSRMGFEPCPPFGEYRPSPHNTWMTIALDRSGARPAQPAVDEIPCETKGEGSR
jgi:putative acetyltransferase